MTVSAWTLLSRASGLLRVVATGAVLGPTFFANTFLATNVVPNVVYSAVAGPVLGLVAVPAVLGALAERGEHGARRLVRSATTVLLAASAAVAVALVVASPVLAAALTAGVPDAGRGRAQLLTALLVLVVAPQVVLYTVAALGAAVLQARGRFALAAAAPALENTGMVVVLGTAAVAYPPGLEVGEVPLGLVVLLGAGATASVGLHAAVQAVGAWRAGLPLRPLARPREVEGTGPFVARMRAAVPVAALPASAYLVLVVLASTVAGGALVLQIAWSVYAFGAALGARAVTTAVQPRLAAAAAAGDGPGFVAAWHRALSLTLLAALPAGCALAVLAVPVAGQLSAGALATGTHVAVLAAVVGVFAVAQVPAGLHEIGRQALFARLDVRGARRIGLLQAVTSVVCGCGTLLVPAGGARLIGIAVAVLVADGAAATAVLARLRAALRPARIADRAGTVTALLAAAAVLPVAAGGALLAGGGRAHDLAVLAGAGLLGAVLVVGVPVVRAGAAVGAAR
ncbi:lipid II flippase MurJ [Pseudonocardia spirodelae]|uniref:Lipid II flippase MurJ n=1 Tax=Pseudonocardia spirodelae TaxID=3133431 RepID=A0ABU8T4G7_9PSEU